MQHVVIREAINKDIPALVELLEKLYSIEKDFDFDSEKQFRGLKLAIGNDSVRVFVAEAKGVVIGMAALHIVISTAMGEKAGVIEDVVVDPTCRSEGVGRQIMSYAEDTAKRQGISRLQLLADKNNSPAVGFYNHLGWSQTQLICLRKSI